MSTLISLLLAAVLSLVGAEIQPDIQNTASVEIVHCTIDHTIVTEQCINQNEQLFKVKEITYEN